MCSLHNLYLNREFGSAFLGHLWVLYAQRFRMIELRVGWKQCKDVCSFITMVTCNTGWILRVVRVRAQHKYIIKYGEIWPEVHGLMKRGYMQGGLLRSSKERARYGRKLIEWDPINSMFCCRLYLFPMIGSTSNGRYSARKRNTSFNGGDFWTSIQICLNDEDWDRNLSGSSLADVIFKKSTVFEWSRWR